MKSNKTKTLIKLIVILPFLILFLFSIKLNININKMAKASQGTDAIAIQIIPNLNHYSPELWYKKQGFNEKYTTLKIDGYEAIQTKRTTYVNVANISGGALNNLKTYIYIMSYNKNADKDTKEIYKKLLNNWHFNTNISSIGTCSISNMYCQTDNDCGGEEYECKLDPDPQTGVTSGYERKFCQLKEIQYCNTDENCSDNLFCTSNKAKITRDTKRLADLETISNIIDSYKKINNQFPLLKSGTYIPGMSISTWNSWDNEFKKTLNTQLPKDPINIMGNCAASSCTGYNFNPDTCWDENKKWFADSDCITPINLPSGSYAYFWNINVNPGPEICVNFETGSMYSLINCIQKVW